MSSAGGNQGARAIIIKSDEEIQRMRDANQIVATTLQMLKNNIEVVVSTGDLEKLAEDFCLKKKAKPAFKGYRGFPGSLCVSINEEVVHGIPSRKRKLKKGDVISIDFGVLYNGYYGDSAVTLAVNGCSAEIQRLLHVTEESLMKGIDQVIVGNRISDISKAVQQCVESNSFSVVRQFVGHGIGTALHEAPEIPNFFQGERTPRLLPGMVLAIEPMVNQGTHKVVILKDGWTVITADKKPSAHFEHSVAVTENGPMVLSSWEIEEF